MISLRKTNVLQAARRGDLVPRESAKRAERSNARRAHSQRCNMVAALVLADVDNLSAYVASRSALLD